MSLSCQGLTIAQLSGTRYTPGRSGYTGAPQPQAIVLHKIEGTEFGAFLNQMCAPLPRFLCAEPEIPCQFPYTQLPKGVHFAVSRTGKVQLANLSDTTFGIDYLDGSYPLGPLVPISDVNGPWIHVAVYGDCADQLVLLLCCIGVSLGISLPIITSGDLQSTRPQWTINSSLQTQVDDCVASGGFVAPPNIFDLEDRVEELEECCANNSSAIATIQTQIINLNNRVGVLELNDAAQDAKIADIYEKIAIIPNLVTAIQTLQNQVADILTRCCPQKQTAVCFDYRIGPGDQQLVTPNQCEWLNFAKRVEDRSEPGCVNGCCGPIVLPGPLWVAKLGCTDCNACETWTLTTNIRFRLAQWCAGKNASIHLVACGVKYLMAQKFIESTGLQVVTLTGTFLLPCGCEDVHLEVCTNDDKITTAKIIEFGQFKGCCV